MTDLERHWEAAEEFDAQLAGLFDAVPSMADAEAFTARVDRRLARRVWTRRAALGIAGATGACIAAAELVGSGLVQRLPHLVSAGTHGLYGGAGQLATEASTLVGTYAAFANPNLQWVAVAGALAVSWAVGRRLERA